MNKFNLLLAGVLMSSAVFSQDISEREKKREFSIEVGGAITSHQEVNYSNVRFKGNGTNVKFSYTRETLKNEISGGINFISAKQKPSTFEPFDKRGNASVLYPRVYASYVHKLNENFSVGGRLDLMDFYFRKTTGLILGNNASYADNGANLAARGKYQRRLNDNFEFEAFLDFNLLSYSRESTSFAFSSPQEALENGEFSYQDKALDSPWALKYYKMSPFWSVLDIRTKVGVNFKNRWALNYNWQVRRRATTKGYPTTFGVHTISVKFDIVNKVKTKKRN